MQKVAINGQFVRETFPNQLESGRAFLVDVKDTVNPKYKQLVVVQEATMGPDENQDINSLLLGWNNKNLLFCWRTVESSIYDKISDKLKTGMFVDELFALLGAKGSFNLELKEYTQKTEPMLYRDNVLVPEAEGRNGASPKINPETDEVMTYQGEPIYRITSLVQGEANHLRLKDSSTGEAAKPSPFVGE
jgi:hypothetical protein